MEPASDGKASSLLTRILLADARMVHAYPRLIIVIGFLLVLGSAWFAFQNLGFKTSGGDLISADDELRVLAQDYRANFREDEDFVMLLEGDDPEQNAAALDWLVGTISKDPLLASEGGQNLFYRIDTSALREKALLYLETGQLAQLQTVLQRMEQGEAGLESWLREANAALDPMQPMGPSQDTTAADPKVLTLLLERLQMALETGETDLDPSLLFGDQAELQQAGELSFEDGRYRLLLLSPLAAEGERPDHRTMVPRLRELMEEGQREWPGVIFHLTGEPVLDYDERRTYDRDAGLALAITLAVVFLIFAYAYRDFVRPTLKITVLISAIILALGFTAATVGHLNILSVAFIVMILGLGDDFAIYVITRYEEERARGNDPKTALEHCLVQSGHAVVMASMTVSISFATMVLTGLPGLMEMGIIAGGGIVLCAILCLTLLPALLLQQRREREGRHHAIQHRFTPILLRAERFWLRHSKGVVVVTLLLLVMSVFSLIRWHQLPTAWANLRAGHDIQQALSDSLRIRFGYDLLDLQNQNLDSVQAVRLLNTLQPIFMALVVVDTLEEAEQLQQDLAELDSVGRVVTILGSSLPGERALPEEQEATFPLAQQLVQEAREITPPPMDEPSADEIIELADSLASRAARMERMARAMGQTGPAADLAELAQASGSLHAALQDLDPGLAGERLGEFQAAIEATLLEVLGFVRTQELDGPVTLDDLPPELRSRYIGRDGRFLVEIYPAEELNTREALQSFDRELRTVTDQATGTPVMLNRFINMLRVGYSTAALYALFFVTLVIAIYFRSWKATLLCLFPLFAGVLFMLSAMQWFGLEFNVANIIVLPLIIGIGVDNGILILQRFRHEPDIELFSRNTGRAILMSNCSTVAGFAALALARHQGIASLGLIMSMGVALTMIVSLISLPAMIHLLKKHKIRI